MKDEKVTIDDDSLKLYYNKLHSEYEYSLKKKDTLTNWSLTILVALISVYFGLSNELNLEGTVKFALVIGTLIILIQFFVNSMLAYGYLKKWRMLREQIENYWIHKNPSLAQITANIKTYDHGGKLSIGWRSMTWAQLQSGFALILIAPIILAIVDLMSTEYTDYHFYVLLALTFFIIWQITIIKLYPKFKIFIKK